MKKIILLALISLFLNGNAQAPVVYFDFLSHDEDTGPWNGSTYYMGDRAKLISLSNYFQSKGITFNMQSDWLYLTNVISKETASVIATTNNKNILRWMHEDKGVEFDPHAHENTYIYPDIVKLMDSLGLPESKLMGGSLYAQKNGVNCWMNLVNGQYGSVFPSRFWQPTYLMGGGTPAHVADLNYYGFWNPKDTDNYLVHFPASPLRHIGVGCEIKLKPTDTVAVLAAKLRQAVNNVQTGNYPQSGFYIQTIFFGHGDLNNTAFYNKLIELADSANAIVATGKAQWKTLKQAYTIWENNGAQMFQWNCGQMASGLEQLSLNETKLRLYPNPNRGSFNLKLDVELQHAELIVINSLGQRVHSQKANYGNNQVELNGLAKGFYYCVVKDGGHQLGSSKLIIE